MVGVILEIVSIITMLVLLYFLIRNSALNSKLDDLNRKISQQTELMKRICISVEARNRASGIAIEADKETTSNSEKIQGHILTGKFSKEKIAKAYKIDAEKLEAICQEMLANGVWTRDEYERFK